MIDLDGGGRIERFCLIAAQQAAAPDQQGRAQPFAAADRVGANRLRQVVRTDGEWEFIFRQKLVDAFGDFSELVDHGIRLSCNSFRILWLP